MRNSKYIRKAFKSFRGTHPQIVEARKNLKKIKRDSRYKILGYVIGLYNECGILDVLVYDNLEKVKRRIII